MNYNKKKINPLQFMFLIILFTMGSAVLFLPSILAGAAKQDAWISAVIGTLFAVVLVLFYNKLYQRCPEKGYIDCVTFVLGKWVGRAVITITLFYFFILATILLWDIGNFLVTQIMDETPLEVIIIIFTLIVIYGVRMGIENLARTAEVFIPWIFLLAFVSILFLLPEIELDNALPLLGGGMKPVLHGSNSMLVFPYLELLVFLMIASNVNQQEKVKKFLILGVVIGGSMLVAVTTYSILVLGAEVTANSLFPVYILGKKISIGGFLERIEVIIAIIWFISIYFKLAITFYFIVNGISQMAKLKDYRTMTFPVGILLVVMTPIMIPSTLYLQGFDIEVFTPLSYIVGLFFPGLVLIVSLIKARRLKQQQEGNENSA